MKTDPMNFMYDFLATMTRERYLKFRHMDTLSFSGSSPSHHEPSKLKTSFSGESKHQTPSESQTALNNFKKGTKRDASVLDHEITPSLLEDINQHSDDSLLQDSIFDAYGQPHHRDIQTLNSSFCDLSSLPPGEPITHAHMHDSNPAEEDWKSLSAVRSATKTSPNLRLDPPKGEDQPQDLTSDVFVYGRPNPDGSDNTPPMSIINFDDLLGRTFLLPMDENGERKRATISEHVKDPLSTTSLKRRSAQIQAQD